MPEIPIDPHKALDLYVKGVLPGRVKRRKVTRLSISDLLSPIRPYFSSLCRDDDKYVGIFRLALFSSIKGLDLDAVALAYHFHTGRSLGYELVNKGVIKSLDDLLTVFIEYRAGLPCIVKESHDNMIIDVYECISCSGLPIIGKPVCYFEAGLLSAILEKLIRTNKVEETKCWSLGDTKCTFIVSFM